MPRTTPELVRGVIDVDDAIDLSPFIFSANELVTEFCAVDVTYSPSRLELIERWLSAHFYATLDQQAESEGVGAVKSKYQGITAMELDGTRWGQQAMLLDTKRYLAHHSKLVAEGRIKIKVGISSMASSAGAPGTGYDLPGSPQ